MRECQSWSKGVMTVRGVGHVGRVKGTVSAGGGVQGL